MNMAQTIAKIHKDRDDEIFNQLIEMVNSKLSNPSWLQVGDNYRRSDDNVFTYTFDLNGTLKSILTDDEKPWASKQIKDRLAKYYYEQGFEASITTMDELTLRIQGIGTGEVDVP